MQTFKNNCRLSASNAGFTKWPMNLPSIKPHTPLLPPIPYFYSHSRPKHNIKAITYTSYGRVRMSRRNVKVEWMKAGGTVCIFFVHYSRAYYRTVWLVVSKQKDRCLGYSVYSPPPTSSNMDSTQRKRKGFSSQVLELRMGRCRECGYNAGWCSSPCSWKQMD